MRNIKLIISYDGTRFSGWQKQKNTGSSIQQIIEQCIAEAAGTECELHASGRTDAGVHAIGQVANFKTQSGLLPKELLKKLNDMLPNDIVIKSAEYADERFHARYNAKGKVYSYRILNSELADPFIRKYSYQPKKKLDVKLICDAFVLLEGSHDFLGFSSLRSSKKSTVRTINSITADSVNDLLTIRYEGNGFLYNMIRIITGSLIEIGLGTIKKEALTDVLTTKDRSKAGFTAPPHGLFLEEVLF